MTILLVIIILLLLLSSSLSLHDQLRDIIGTDNNSNTNKDTHSIIKELELQKAELEKLILLHKNVYSTINDSNNNDDNDDDINLYKNDYGFIDRRKLAGLNLFGIGSRLEPEAGSVSMLIIIFAVLFVETCFELLNEVVHDTPFEGMIKAIESELMVVGTMAFIFKIILYTSTLIPYNYIYGLEFADLLVPITSFFLCAQGMVLIVMSVNICDMWSKAYNMNKAELLDDFLTLCSQWPHKWHWLPVSMINSEMEFRIFHSIFCETYTISRKAFAFDEYVQRVFEKYLLDIISIEMIDWLIICALCLANWARINLRLQFANCTHEHSALDDDLGLHSTHSGYDDHSDRRVLGASAGDPTKVPGLLSEDAAYAECQALGEMKLFTIIGTILFTIVLVLAIVSRLYELRILATRGVLSIDDYSEVLTATELNLDKAEQENGKMLSEGELKDAVNKAKKLAEEHKEQTKMEEYLSFRKASSRLLEDLKEQLIALLSGHLLKSCLLHLGFFKPKEKPSSRRVAPSGNRQRTNSSESPTGSKQRTNSKDNNDNLPSPRRQSAIDREELVKSFAMRLKKNEILRQCFFLARPDMYFDCVESMIMMISFYIALWTTNQLTRARKLKHENFMGWQTLAIVPGILSFLLYIYVIKVAALLKSVVSIDNDLLEQTIEQTEDSRRLGIAMKEKLLERLEFIGKAEGNSPDQQLRELFDEIDDNGSQQLSREEFKVFLNAVGITFSRERWRQIFREIDKDHNDEISFKELHIFLHPDDSEAKKQELKELRVLEQRVQRKSIRNQSQKNGRKPSIIAKITDDDDDNDDDTNAKKLAKVPSLEMEDV